MLRYISEIAVGFLLIVFSLQLNIGGFLKTTAGRFLNSSAEKKTDDLNLSYIIIIVFSFVLFAVLLLFRVDTIPVPYHVDEAGMAYDAKSIVNYGVDRYLYKYPVYLINFGGGQSVLYAYLAALFFKLFGFSVLTVRLPAITLSLISALIFVLTVRKEYGNVSSIIMAGLFCFLPFSIMHSRWGLDSYLLFPMMIISCSIFFRAVRTGNIWLYVFSGLSFGLTLYSYVLSYILVPLFLSLSILFLICTKQIKWRHLFAMGIPLFILAVPLLLLICVNSGLIGEIRTPFLSIPKLPIYRESEMNIKNFVNHLRFNRNNILYKLFITDGDPLNANIKFGTLYYFSIPLIIWGVILSAKNAAVSFREKRFSLDLMMLILLVSGVFKSLMLFETNIYRCCEIYIPLFYFLCIGILTLYQKKKTAAAITGILFAVHFAFFYYGYMTDYPKEPVQPDMVVSVEDLKNALEYVSAIDNDKIYISQQNYLWTILALDIDPYTFNEKKESVGVYVKRFDRFQYTGYVSLDSIDHDAVYICRDPREIYDIVASFHFDSEKFNTIEVLHKPK